MNYRTLLQQRRKRLEKAESALDLLSDPDVQAQLSVDPEMRDAFMAAIQRNGTAMPAAPAALVMHGHVPIVRAVPPPGSLLRSVLDAAKQEIGDFTVATIVSRMEDGGYSFAAQDAKVAAGSALKDLADRGFIELISRGRGRRASVYRYTKKEVQE